jgi:hypothetical protein
LKHEVCVHVRWETETLLSVILKYFTLGNPAVSHVHVFYYAQDSINVTVSRLHRLDDRAVVVRFPAGARDFSVLRNIQTGAMSC